MPHDIVLWGATGFTGRLVAGYLLERVGVGGDAPDWALAGRSPAKLESLRGELAEADPAAADLPLIVGDARDPESLRALAREARVVCTTVGPYSEYGSDLVAACVDEGAHYCDLTGEAHWMKQMIDSHHEAAKAAKLRIVHACGFDSIPSDLGCLVLQEHAREVRGAPFPRVTNYARRVRGGASGGTIASMAATMEQAAEDRAVRRTLADPYALLPEGAERGPEVRDVRSVAWDDDERAWTTVFVMATTNAKVVRRSAALLDYGADFAYEEVQSLPPGLGSWVRAWGLTAGLGVFAAGMSRSFTRKLLRRMLPEPGEGPDRAAREAGSFTMEVVGRDGSEARVRVHGDQDPGYGATSGMLAEAALCLALDELPERYGVIPPAVAMGRALVDRLPRAGVSFELIERAD